MPEQYDDDLRAEAEGIQLRTDEVQEILTSIPNWIIRWGMTVIFFTVVMVITASFFIKYPDIIESRVMLTTEIPPTEVVTRAEGKITFFVEDKKFVEEGQLLAVMENPAETDDLLALDDWLKPFQEEWEQILVAPRFDSLQEDWQLGAVQPSYLTLRKALLDYDRFVELDFYAQQIAALHQRIATYAELNGQLARQIHLHEEELAVTRREFKTDSLLWTKQSLTDREYTTSRNRLLQTERNYEVTSTQRINNKITVSQLEAQITELRLNQEKEQGMLRASIAETLQQLGSQVEAWKQQFLLTAPIDGQVTLSAVRADNQFVPLNSEVLTIIPDTTQVEKGALVGQLLAPVRNSGKLAVGQRVIIRFDNYPSNEYGMVLGEVINISGVPREDMYLIQVNLTDGLNTTYKKSLEYRPKMSGSAQIITEDLRLIDRIMYQFRALVDRTNGS